MPIDSNPQGMAMVLVHISKVRFFPVKDAAGKKRGGGGQTKSSGSGDGDLVDDDGDKSESHNVLRLPSELLRPVIGCRYVRIIMSHI